MDKPGGVTRQLEAESSKLKANATKNAAIRGVFLER
jgi:hypothetical protein